MGIFRNIRRQLHHYLLKKELSHNRVIHQSVDFHNAQKIGILFDSSDLKDREIVLEYARNLKKEGKKVKLLAYLHSQPKNDNYVFEHFNKTDLDWALRPKNQRVTDFIKQPFDILINLSKNENLPLEYVAALSHAKFRVGPFTEKTFCYELMIETGDHKDLKAFLDQVTFFLSKIKTTHEASI